MKSINYRGVGSAEFKLDSRDYKLKLIELNPRYWQQNALAEKCGMNFPLVNYLDLTGCEPKPMFDYIQGIKWINIHRDFDSFRDYKKRGELSLLKWLKSLNGPKMFSDFALDDIYLSFYKIALQMVLIRLGKYLVRIVK